jgi:hypothetical protein
MALCTNIFWNKGKIKIVWRNVDGTICIYIFIYRVEKYYNLLVADEESDSPITEMSKIFFFVFNFQL